MIEWLLKLGKNMSILEIIQLIIGSGGALGILLIVFRFGKMAEKMNTISTKLSANDAKIDMLSLNVKKDIFESKEELKREISKLDSHSQQIYTALSCIQVQIGKLEIRLEERTLRTRYESAKEYAGTIQ